MLNHLNFTKFSEPGIVTTLILQLRKLGHRDYILSKIIELRFKSWKSGSKVLASFILPHCSSFSYPCVHIAHTYDHSASNIVSMQC